MNVKVKIGVEVHAQLKTRTKLFCSCSTKYGAIPNSQVCPVCLGMPGTLPVLNKQAVKLAIKAALALNCRINEFSLFARKNYFYPDLPKGYQITQYQYPLAADGWVDIDGHRIRIRRVHLEEDAGKIIHMGDRILIDYNRCGIPLIEIVTEPDLTSGEQAYKYLVYLRQLLRYIDVCGGDMEKGELRCEPNISVEVDGIKGERVEIKNLNSIRAVEKAINYEIERQITILRAGKKVEMTTLLWNETTGKTEPMRVKEEEADYRYFPEPDLPPLIVKPEEIAMIRVELPELPQKKLERFVKTYKLSDRDAQILAFNLPLSEYYEKLVKLGVSPHRASSFIISEVLALLKREKKGIEELNVSPEALAELLKLVEAGNLTLNIAKTVFVKMEEHNLSAREVLEREGIVQIRETDKLKEIVMQVMQENPKEVARYRAGERKLLTFFMGQVMRKTRGQANPHIARQLLVEMLEGG